MKKQIIICMMLFTVVMYSQKKKNGTIYNEHPAIVAVEAMQQADINGDAEKVATYLADDFKSYSGTSTNKNQKGMDKERYLTWVTNREKWLSYRSLTRQGEAYPDAIEYKDGEVWVQTWNYLKGVHNDTGVKVEMPIHNLYKLNKDNKIIVEINYNNNIGRDIRAAFTPRTNGTLYNQHDNINKVRRMMAAFENGDLEKAYSFFDEKATFANLEMAIGESLTLEESKERNKGMRERFEIKSVDVVGYPDYLHYEISDGRVVQSWWNFTLIRKSDKKKIVVPAMYTHDFNEDGMITNSMAYYSSKALDAK